MEYQRIKLALAICKTSTLSTVLCPIILNVLGGQCITQVALKIIMSFKEAEGQEQERSWEHWQMEVDTGSEIGVGILYAYDSTRNKFLSHGTLVDF